MRILIVTQDFPPETGGIQAFIYEMAKHFLARGHAVTVVCPGARNTPSPLPPEGRVIRIPIHSSWLFLPLLFRLPRILHAGNFDRLVHAKGVDVLLRAYAGLPPALRDSHPVTLVGDGPYLSELQTLMKELHITNRVQIEKWKSSEDLARAVRSHQLVVLPSREESFGNTMLETLATGERLLTTEAGSIPEVTGEFAWKVPPGNIDALRAEMERLLDESPDPQQSGRQVEYVKDRFSWEKTGAQYLALYRS